MTLQDRINTLEAEARGRIRRVLSTGNEKLMELDGALAKVAREDWTVPGLRRQLNELRARAEKVGTSTLKKVESLPAEAVTKFAANTRTPVKNLAKSLAELARKMEPPKPRAVAKPAEPKAEARPESKVATAS